MLISTCRVAALLLTSVTLAAAMAGNRLGASPYYLNYGACPERCSISGPEPGNWSVYSDLVQLRNCQETMFYAFSLFDPIDDDSTTHRIHACTSFGPDFSLLPNSTTLQASASSPVNANYEIGWWKEGFGLASSGIRSLTKQARHYLTHGHGATDGPTIMFAQFGEATIGLYAGQGLESRILGSSALKIFEDNLTNLNVTAPALAMQLCGPDSGSEHSFGLMVTSNATFGPIQNAVQTWANGTCLSFSQSTNMTGEVLYTKPLDVLTDVKNSTKPEKPVSTSDQHGRRHQHLHVRAECKTTRVESGDSCAKLAKRCGISASDFTKYNSGSKFCAELVPKQYVCCSKGELPDLRPSKNKDGSCHAYKVDKGDNCASIAIENGLKIDDLEKFNKKTWGWAGCKRLFYKTVMCLSEGTPPFPDEIANAQCGPQKPGTKKTGDTTDISDLNPCPLNACCNIWGQCGITKEFCTDTNTGAPGTAKEGTNGCISNCGTKIVKSGGDGSIRIGYFQGYGMSRPCLYQDASQIDTSKYTHLHFAFGTLTKNFDVEVGDKLSQDQFREFASLSSVKKILSFGGWDFSANPATYSIFREGVKSANRLTMASKIAAFIIDNKPDGVDIDWEYPGAPDIPGIPPAEKDEGKNYLAFLVVLKNLLRGKSVSIAAPSSYWYLKQYPIKDIARVVDYIVYMTYDLHGQWDTENSFSQEGCALGNCLRSQVNLTETQYSLAMITKAGVPSNKVIVGVTSYGRSFKMAQAGCYGPDCFYTGSKMQSEAKKGKCTDTAGYIADAEIDEILKDKSRVVKHFVDSTSHSDILIYDDTEWVSYMSPSTKMAREAVYKAFGMGGTTDWAVDLQKYNDVPKPAKSWAIFKQDARGGENPRLDKTRTGKWTQLDCTSKYIDDITDYTATELWKGTGADDAWKDVLRIWREVDKGKRTFSHSVSRNLKVDSEPNCQSIATTDCNKRAECENGMNGPLSGPAGKFVWNSLVGIHKMYTDFHNDLYKAIAVISFSLDDFNNKFAPIPDPEDNKWLLVLIDLLTWGAGSVAAPFFNSVLRTMPFFHTKPNTLDNTKDTTMTLIGQSTTLAKDLLTTEGADWTVKKQDSFKSYMGQVLDGWGKLANASLVQLFNGSDSSIDVLSEVISDGKMLLDGKVSVDSQPNLNLQGDIEKSFYGFTIPTLWRISDTYAFVLDSGYDCLKEYPVKEYADKKTMDATSTCYEGRRYYLFHPKGDATECRNDCTTKDCQQTCKNNKFSTPPGIESLNGTAFGGITVKDLIAGSVRTYNHNGKKNSLDPLKPIASDLNKQDLLDVDITTPGIVRLPVCSPERAFQGWDKSSKGSSSFFPCDRIPGTKKCQESSFKDETSGTSPLADDCRTILKNIENDPNTMWTTQVLGKRHRTIVRYGTCALGVEATIGDGNVDFYVGGEDVQDFINTAIEKYSKDGKIGATGDVKCKGNSKEQPVHWAIYQNK
ncbi:glycosylhydrolase family 18-6 [Fusarium austroafricanum]|uniref:chitinase n=1 Tax=Fusarium austroafricanum TaxID=2364996 RepID=A0A8H4JY35_9HYPO|nr:glycosylhydrolase family 18-6 [Fusarium austroafricanum]